MTPAPAKAKHAGGAPKGSGSKYTQVLANQICRRVSEGEPLRAVSRDIQIPWRTIYAWMEAHPKFASAIARARELGQEAILEDTLRLADTPLLGVTTTLKGNGEVEEKKEDMLGHRKLQIETRLKLLAKWNPKRYGDKVETTHKGDAANPVFISSVDAKL